jgi:hypothetical protein
MRPLPRAAVCLAISAQVHDTVMLGRASGVVSGPPDYRQKFLGHFDLWHLSDLDARLVE